MDAENYERSVIGGLKGDSMLREMDAESVVLMMFGCAVGIALAVSIGMLNTEQSEQHWLRLVLSWLVVSGLSSVTLPVSWQGMAVWLF